MNKQTISLSEVERNLRQDSLRKEISMLVEEYGHIQYGNTTFSPGETIIPPAGKLIDSSELKMMVEASLDGWLTTGRFNALFEEKLAQFIGVKYLITVNSGSSANLVAFSTLTSPKLLILSLKHTISMSKNWRPQLPPRLKRLCWRIPWETPLTLK